MKTENLVNQEGNSNFSQAFLWFGAAISIAEILTGALIAPLGLAGGIAAILMGHFIGAVILFMAGMIGAESGLAAIESTRISFGKYGSYGFSILNILQLIGWTAIMVINGAKALDGVTGSVFRYQNEKLWSVVIALFIAIWIIVGLKKLAKINAVVVTALFVCSVVLGLVVFQSKAHAPVRGGMTFGGAVELSVVMSLSWLPLIADYTREVKYKKAGTVWSVLGYCCGSSLMFIIGLGAAIYAGTSDICAILLTAGMGSVALIIVVFSTVTTTFLDVYSAGVSYVNIRPKTDEKVVALIVCLLGLLLALLVSMRQYENFLYWIGSVFAPLFAILLTDYFIFQKKAVIPDAVFSLKNTVLWGAGVVFYYLLLPYGSPFGTTLPVMVGIGALCILVNGGIKLCPKNP